MVLVNAFVVFLFIVIVATSANAKTFVIQNESVNQFVVNGSSGNIILNPNAGFGNVGIGTTTPNYLLQVASGTDGRSVNLSNVLYVNGSSGNVGIGTTSPSSLLQVAGTANITSASTQFLVNSNGDVTINLKG